MAQSGFTPIQLYYSNTASAAPIPGNLANGELAINITDGKLYYKDNLGAIQTIADKAYSTRVTTISFGLTGLTPSTATSGAVTVGGTLGVANGGTGQSTQQAALDAIAGSATSGSYLRGNGTNVVMSTIQAADLPTATDSANGAIKLGSGTAQSVAANTVTATASRSYALQLNGTGQGVVNVPWTDTLYTLPAATSTVRGGIELGSDTVQSVAANSVTATASRTYALQVNSDGQGVVNVPWTTAGTPPGGSTTQVQYNNAGAFAGSANFTFNGTTVTTANDASISGLIVGKGGGSGASNTAFGNAALAGNSTGVNLVAVGSSALLGNTSGIYNVAVGSSSLLTNSTGSRNVAVGHEALRSSSTASENTAVGAQALQATTGTSNTAVGALAGTNATIGDQNTFIGRAAGNSVTTGGANTFIGQGAGTLVTTGFSNTVVGIFNGNQNGLDIRTANNYIVLADGGGNPRIYHNGTTVVIPNLPTSATGLPTGALYKDGSGFLKVA
jgi:hypothetical protein